jgi:hypothetical protein
MSAWLIKPACVARTQVTDRKNFALGWIGLQIAIEHFRRKAEAYLGRQRYNQSIKAK